MNNLSLSQLVQASGGELLGADCAVRGYSTDTRTLVAQDLYFCLVGENFDGHDFIAKAISAGACAIVCDKKIQTTIPQLIVSDTRKAFGIFAKLWRAQFRKPIAGITGSNGKTTVKQLLASIFKQVGNVHFTRANDNNEVGVPQTLLGLSEDHDYAVIEMGASQVGDIEWLGELVQPDVALITNASIAHAEGLGDSSAVAAEKAWIYKCLATGGTAVINADDSFCDYWLEVCDTKPVITFGSAGAVVAVRLPDDSISIGYSGQSVTCDFNFAGEHNISNAAAAAACAIAVGLSLDVIAAGLAAAVPVAGRLNIVPLANGITVIDDTYNANPASVRAAIDVLSGSAGMHVVVLGDLLELGVTEVEQHKAIGEYAFSHKVDRLMACGNLTKHAVHAFGSGANWFESKDQLLEILTDELKTDSTVLVKGSRSMKMEEVVASLCAQFDNAQATTEVCGS